MASTPKGVPYPAETDANDAPADLQALAEWVDQNPGIGVYTTAQRDALAGADLWDGRVILNATTLLLERYDATAVLWRAATTTDHGALTGLGDDDHPQYLTTGRHDTPARHGATVVDHGSIGGLGDDDHPQYVKKAGDTMTGRLGLKTYRETVSVQGPLSGNVTCDIQAATLHRIDPNGAITVAFANYTDGDSWTLVINAWGAGFSSVTWPSGVKWVGDAAPDLAANKWHYVTFWAYSGQLIAAYTGSHA